MNRVEKTSLPHRLLCAAGIALAAESGACSTQALRPIEAVHQQCQDTSKNVQSCIEDSNDFQRIARDHVANLSKYEAGFVKEKDWPHLSKEQIEQIVAANPNFKAEITPDGRVSTIVYTFSDKEYTIPYEHPFLGKYIQLAFNKIEDFFGRWGFLTIFQEADMSTLKVSNFHFLEFDAHRNGSSSIKRHFVSLFGYGSDFDTVAEDEEWEVTGKTGNSLSAFTGGWINETYTCRRSDDECEKLGYFANYSEKSRGGPRVNYLFETDDNGHLRVKMHHTEDSNNPKKKDKIISFPSETFAVELHGKFDGARLSADEKYTYYQLPSGYWYATREDLTAEDDKRQTDFFVFNPENHRISPMFMFSLGATGIRHAE